MIVFIVTNVVFAITFIYVTEEYSDNNIYENVLYLFALIIIVVPFFGLICYRLREFCMSCCTRNK
jgi:hypothetical protein